MKSKLTLQVNGDACEIEAAPADTLLDVLRIQLGITSPKRACDRGECGACTVLVDGNPVNACLLFAHKAADHTLTTVEGLGRGKTLHPLQRAFHEMGLLSAAFVRRACFCRQRHCSSEIPCQMKRRSAMPSQETSADAQDT